MRIKSEMWFPTFELYLKGGGDGHLQGVCCAPAPPPPAPPPPARPAVQIRNADSSCPPGEVPEDGLTDADGSVHEAAIDCTMWWGVTTRTSAGRFSPTGKVTRGLMAEWIARFLDRTGGQLPDSAEDQFSDDETSVHEESINRIASVGVAGGTSQGVYSPGAAITRGQMASFLARLLDVAVDGGRATPPS